MRSTFKVLFYVKKGSEEVRQNIYRSMQLQHKGIKL